MCQSCQQTLAAGSGPSHSRFNQTRHRSSMICKHFPSSSPFLYCAHTPAVTLLFSTPTLFGLRHVFTRTPPPIFFIVSDSCLSVLLISLILLPPNPHRNSPPPNKGGEDTRPSREDPAPRFSELYRSGPVTLLSSLIPHRQADRQVDRLTMSRQLRSPANSA